MFYLCTYARSKAYNQDANLNLSHRGNPEYWWKASKSLDWMLLKHFSQIFSEEEALTDRCNELITSEVILWCNLEQGLSLWDPVRRRLKERRSKVRGHAWGAMCKDIEIKIHNAVMVGPLHKLRVTKMDFWQLCARTPWVLNVTNGENSSREAKNHSNGSFNGIYGRPIEAFNFRNCRPNETGRTESSG